MWALIDQLHPQGIHVILKSLRGDAAVWLSDKEYAWSHFPQDDAKDWETFLEQVGHCGPQGHWVNHFVFAAVACRYDCDLTIVERCLTGTCLCSPIGEKACVEFNRRSLC